MDFYSSKVCKRINAHERLSNEGSDHVVTIKHTFINGIELYTFKKKAVLVLSQEEYISVFGAINLNFYVISSL